MRITIIGSGNVAWNLALAFEQSDQNIQCIYSRNLHNAQKLADRLFAAEATDTLDFSDSNAEVFIIALKDELIDFVIQAMQIPGKAIVAHTSGSAGIEILKGVSNPKGVFYPLQTFSKEKPVSFTNVPICIEASDKATEKKLQKLAFSVSEHVCFVDSHDRKNLHLAAVFACNFTNHFLHISKHLLEQEGLDFKILKPLIQETIRKALKHGPENSQTGPAIRNDNQILSEHQAMLNDEPELQKIYELISDEIKNRNKF